MKKVLSLVLAIVMMASLLVVSTSAAIVPFPSVTVGLSTGDAIANATALKANAETIVAVGDTANLTATRLVFPTLTNPTAKFGAENGAVTFYVDLATLFGTYAAGDYTTATVTKGYSIVSMASAMVTGTNLMTVTLTPASSTVNGGEVNLTFTRNVWNSTTKTYTAQPKVVKFTFDVPTATTLTPVPDGKGGYVYTLAGGTVIDAATIKAVSGKALTLYQNTNLAVTFPKVANLTPVNLAATVSNSYAGIDAPANTMKVVKFASNFAVADAAMVTYALDYDFINLNGTDLNVYFIEDVEGSSTTVKGAKATFVQKGIYVANNAAMFGASSVSFNLLDNKLGTYVITSKTLESAGTTASSSTVGNVNTGADSVVNVAIVFAVLALAAAGFVAVKKVK